MYVVIIFTGGEAARGARAGARREGRSGPAEKSPRPKYDMITYDYVYVYNMCMYVYVYIYIYIYIVQFS